MPENGRPRQEPASCQSCRKKKLKCDRLQPCSNCSSRDVPCVFAGQSPASTTAAVRGHDEIAALKAENTSMKARLERVEQVLFGGSTPLDVEERPLKSRRLNTADDGRSPCPNGSESSDREIAAAYRGDTQWLERIGTRENSRLPQLSAQFIIRVGSVEQISEHVEAGDYHDRLILLPNESQTMELFMAYTQYMDPVQPLVHIPTARCSIQRLYQRLQSGEWIDPNDTVLLLSMHISILAYWGLADNSNPLFVTSQQARKVAIYWLRTVLDIFEHVRRSTSANLETVQSHILCLFLLYHIEGYSPKIRSILASAIAAAKEIGMHKTDSHIHTTSEDSQADVIDREMRRRVWWHLVSTDWKLSFVGGPHEGTYMINKRHMRVNKPRNVSDEDLQTQPSDFSRPLSEPTTSAFLLQRIRLAEVCRDISDKAWIKDLEEFTVDDVAAIDAEFVRRLEELPDFLQRDESRRQRFQYLESQYPHIVLQRYFVNLNIYARRCRFHLSFLSRTSTDSRYSFSRDACLYSARAVLQLRKDLVDEQRSLWITSTRLVGVLHLFFYAIVVLVMDLCINRAAGNEEARKAEIQEACKMLEQAKRQSDAAGMFFDSLMAILRKHRIRLHNYEHCGQVDSTSPRLAAVEANALGPGSSYGIDQQASSNVEEPFSNMDFDELWQSFVGLDSTFDPTNWDALLKDIESHID